MNHRMVTLADLGLSLRGRCPVPKVRRPAVAGRFYPADASELARMVEHFLDDVEEVAPAPKALIAPHAGYIYSGAVAATAYASLRESRSRVSRVILLGPSHWFSFPGLALPEADALATPAGTVEVDREGVEIALRFNQVSVRDDVYEREHSLEVHLPFLQAVLGSFAVTPLLIGRASSTAVSRVLDALWGDDSTLLAVSSDLSHYHDYETANRLDGATSLAIQALESERITSRDACGWLPIHGLLETAQRRGMRVREVDLRNSGDTGGPRDRVVGYGSFLFYDANQ